MDKLLLLAQAVGELKSEVQVLKDNPPEIHNFVGEAGKNGKDGLNGADGKDGKDGIDGKDGKDGEDGVSITDAQVDFDGSLVITLSNGKEIDAGSVLSPDASAKIQSISTNGGGTSQPVLDAIEALQKPIGPTFTYTSGLLTSIAYSSGETSTLTYTSGLLTRLDFTRKGVTTRKTFNYTSGILTSITQVTL
jgi:hypothetical protein